MVDSKLMRLYEILRHNLILDLENREENTKKFEEIAIKIDIEDQKKYEDEIDSKLYPTTTLENESQKLQDLIAFIEKREKLRQNLTDDFHNVTGSVLTTLKPIKGLENLDGYKKRLSYINEYLNNQSQLDRIESEIKELEEQLKKNNQTKDNDEKKNREYEEELLETFITIISNNPKLCELDILDKDIEFINTILNKLNKDAEANKEHLNTYTSCYQALLEAGISGEERSKYLEYTKIARNDYYNVKEEEYIYKIYKLLKEEKYEYQSIFAKRLNLKNLLEERLSLRDKMEIESPDLLYNFYLVSNEQYHEIFQQQVNIEAISHLNERISFDKERQEILENANQKVEILSILKEYNLLSVYEDDITEEKTLENEFSLVEEKEYTKDTAIISVKDSNMEKEVYQKALQVMQRVGESLGIVQEQQLVTVEKPSDEIFETSKIDDIFTEEESSNIFEEKPIFEELDEKDAFFSSNEPELDSKLNDIFNEKPQLDIFEDNKEEPIFENKIEEKIESPTLDDIFTEEESSDIFEQSPSNEPFFGTSDFESELNDIFNEKPQLDIFENKVETPMFENKVDDSIFEEPSIGEPIFDTQVTEEPKKEENNFFGTIETKEDDFFSTDEMRELLLNTESEPEIEPMDDMPPLPSFGTVHPVEYEDDSVEDLRKQMPNVAFPSLDDSNQQPIPIKGKEYFENDFPEIFRKED